MYEYTPPFADHSTSPSLLSTPTGNDPEENPSILTRKLLCRLHWAILILFPTLSLFEDLSEEGYPIRHPGDAGTCFRSAHEDHRARQAFMTQPEIDDVLGILYQEPQTLKEVMSSLQASKWWVSIVEQIESLWEYNTWILVELPPGRPVIPCKFHYKVKRGRDGALYRLKSRLFIKGLRHIPGIDFNDYSTPSLGSTPFAYFCPLPQPWI